MGSGSTKAYVAQVDVCKKQIVSRVWSEQTPIGFKDALKSNHGKFSDDLIQQARERFLSLLTRMREQKAQRITAVATAAFREAENGAEAAINILATSGVPILIVSQEEEARLGVRAALAVSQADEEKAAIWDIGGGSMQITYPDAHKTPRIFAGSLASVNFKDAVISRVQKKDPGKTKSPNPLGPAYEAATELARQRCLEKTPRGLKERAQNLRWLGIGGVWWHSLRKQLGGNIVIEEKDLAETLKARSKLADGDIGGDYAATDVTNLALVLGFMRCLGIQKVEAIDASLVQGLVLE